ncbi:MAG TPA: diguanylate cyclase [Pelotomaculum sp.]|nr:diguanylate cyclase [Pelotomaculum sp.]
MHLENWVKDAGVAITICDPEGIILDMNEKSCQIFAKDGGKLLIGTNLLECHPEGARKKLAAMLKDQTVNCYTTEKNGVKKLVYQTPWYRDGQYMGFVEMLIEIPFEIPNYLR